MAEQTGDHDQVLATGQRRFDRGVLAGEADHPPDLFRVPDRVDSRNGQRSAVRPEQRRNGPDERGLAGPVRSEHGGHLARRSDEVEPGERMDLAVVLGETDRFDGGGRWTGVGG